MSAPEIIIPNDRQHWLELRTQDITSTEMSALFGANPYGTLFELAHQKANKTIVELEENDRMKWGKRLEESIAKGVAEDQGWEVRRANEYIRLPHLRIGASFDFFIGDDGILEIKNVDALAFREGWFIDDNGHVEAPAHIEFQVQVQLLVSGRKYAYIAALVGGNRVVLIKREADLAVHDAILVQAGAFWHKIDNNIPFHPNFEEDAAFIATLYGFAQPGKVWDVKGDEVIRNLALEYANAADNEKEAKKRKDGIKAQLLMAIGDHEKVLGDGFTISAGMVGPARVEYDREGYRNWRVSWKKGARE